MNAETPVVSQKTRDVLATMAIENMFLDDEFVNKLNAIEKGELTYDDVRKEIIQEYAGL